MGYQHGAGNDIVEIVRTGSAFNPDVDVMDPTLFSYTLDEPPLVESWGQGMVVLHNPKSLRPIPRDFFVDATQGLPRERTPKNFTIQDGTIFRRRRCIFI